MSDKAVCRTAPATPGLLIIPNINLNNISKEDVQKAISKSHLEDMMTQFESASKLEGIKNSNFNEMQSYFNERNFENSRIKCEIRSKML